MLELLSWASHRWAHAFLKFSPAFLADCLETIIEIGDEYQEIFEEHGGETIQLVASCNTEETWIHGLSDFIRQRV